VTYGTGVRSNRFANDIHAQMCVRERRARDVVLNAVGLSAVGPLQVCNSNNSQVAHVIHGAAGQRRAVGRTTLLVAADMNDVLQGGAENVEQNIVFRRRILSDQNSVLGRRAINGDVLKAVVRSVQIDGRPGRPRAQTAREPMNASSVIRAVDVNAGPYVRHS